MLSKVSAALTTYSCSVKLSTVGRAPTGGTDRMGVETAIGGAAGGTSRGTSFLGGSLPATGTATNGVSAGGEAGGVAGFSGCLSTTGTVGGAASGAELGGGGATPTAEGGGDVRVSGGLALASADEGGTVEGGGIGAALGGVSTVGETGPDLAPSAGAATAGGGGLIAGGGGATVEDSPSGGSGAGMWSEASLLADFVRSAFSSFFSVFGPLGFFSSAFVGSTGLAKRGALSFFSGCLVASSVADGTDAAVVSVPVAGD